MFKITVVNLLSKMLRVVTEGFDRMEKAMSQSADKINASIGLLNDATTAVGAKIDELRAQIKTDMTKEEVETADKKLAGLASQLRGFAADPENPVPTPDPNLPVDTSTPPTDQTPTDPANPVA